METTGYINKDRGGKGGWQDIVNSMYYIRGSDFLAVIITEKRFN